MNRSFLIGALLTALLSACTPPAPPASPSGQALTVQGRAVIPTQFLDSETTRAQLYMNARAWLIDAGGAARASAPLDANGNYVITNVPANTAGQRIVVIFGSASDAPILEAPLASLDPANASVTVNVTLNTTYAAQIARDPTLRAAYAAELEAQYKAAGGTGTPNVPVDAFTNVGADLSSLADGGEGGAIIEAPATAASLRAASTGKVCTTVGTNWNFFHWTLWSTTETKCVPVPDVVIMGRVGALPGDPIFTGIPVEVARLKGTEIAKKITWADRDLRMERTADGKLRFSGVNGVVAAGSANVVAAGSANVVAAGSANVVAAGGMNLISVNQGYVLKAGETALLSASSAYGNFILIKSGAVAAGGANVVAAGGGNVVAAGGMNLIGAAAGNVVAAGSANMVNRYRVAANSNASTDPAFASTQANRTGASTVAGSAGTTNLQVAALVDVTAAPGHAFKAGGKARLVTYRTDASYQAIWMGPGINKTAVPLNLDANGVATVDVPAGIQGSIATITLAKLAVGAHPDDATNYSATRTVRFSTSTGTHSAGSVDTSFAGGALEFQLPGFWTFTPTASAIQPDGKIIIVGYGTAEFTQRALGGITRYHENGTLDTTFGTNGVVSFERPESVEQVALQSDGKIVILGMDPTNSIPALVRFNSNGTWDTSYGNAGLVEGYGPWQGFRLGRLVMLPDDRLLVAVGRSLHRYTTTGVMDETFGVAGVAHMDEATGNGIYDYRRVNAIELMSDGRIIAVGANAHVNGGMGWDAVIARFTANGGKDTTFSGDGVAQMNFLNDHESFHDVRVAPDGGIVTLFRSDNGDSGILKLTATGEVDTAYGVNGIARHDIIPDDGLKTVFIPYFVQQPDGKLLVADQYNGMVRLNANGTHDTTFPLTVPADQNTFSIAHLNSHADGRILVLTKYFSNTSGHPVRVVRYWP